MSMVIPTKNEPSLHLGGKLHINLPVSQLVEHAILRNEAVLTESGAICATTGAFTGRSPKDKFIVQEPSVAEHIDWGSVNQPMEPEKFERLLKRLQSYLAEKELYIFDGFAGADPAYRLPIRVINEYAWQNLFVHQLFIRPSKEELEAHDPEFTVICAPDFKADPKSDGTRSETVIAVSFEHKMVLIAGTRYAGEMKKSIFSVMNYLLPERGVLPMHCSANIGKEGDVALFFGLSGTGKTTLSADPERSLIGDDEHGWSDKGVFNMEGGCYAKCIGLTEEKEPQIYRAIRFGSVLENVVVDQDGVPDYADASLTENTRAAYPIHHISGSVIPGIAGHPKVILFLTADAFGVLPPISKLTPEQAMYHFLSGYTSKLAGTERGVTEPEATFSTCFGAPFLPRPASVYAEMLGEKIDKHQVDVYLVNTGWTGGPYATGKRMDLKYTRAMVRAAISGELKKADYETDPVFGLSMPKTCPDVPDEILNPRNTWDDPKAYDEKAQELARRFHTHFAKFKHIKDEIRNAGPRL
ncbi:phosphoenolpyruvate carboxykinase (ATP) [Thermoactinomyces intermedius]|jgi:phosphoenolpyruvate carboxykinase (ATP)|uniref:Phosphoenolpyruvate carboxykinase (ATP) n=1 Tax=Thermoactinomyces intermedius TaxID=2024 RepID=A0A8I1A9S0_THEIN|nr:phosphoenolpyruvate carboxykinase (ATP) [Thermoactinomyces intermedius]MBA4548437.1 phosphoenolpyruvate carboxykinase (ATP) [Thermoactinomyces intermedius]MBA4837526.1 phosphoenolpyruvate carboxykinase (ATP) [Thermoactinomyces intermedius]MBH8595281.1 phosphoenolpyruvate carboxykinase (ATP) [Thermoactinomyces intermedius]